MNGEAPILPPDEKKTYDDLYEKASVSERADLDAMRAEDEARHADVVAAERAKLEAEDTASRAQSMAEEATTGLPELHTDANGMQVLPDELEAVKENNEYGQGGPRA